MTIARYARGGALLAAVLALPACTDWAGYDLDKAAGKVQVFSTMRNSVVPDPYEMVREPAEGAVPTYHPLGDVPAPYTQAQLDSVAPTLTNPLRSTPATLARGRYVYETNCSVCHGALGDGKGTVIGPEKFPFAPAVNAGPTQARSDGYIYGVIDVGRGLMPPYGARIPHLDRWAVVSYVRQLQGGLETRNPPPSVSPAGAAAEQAAGAGPGAQPQAPQAGPPATVEQNRNSP
ncbi:MAG TPA: cytochrome c [Longimicrobium sp.]|nr:cytochrome c [Longimicrobium sp.]